MLRTQKCSDVWQAQGAIVVPVKGGAAKRALPQQTAAELQRFRAAVDTCVDSIYMVDRETLKFVDATASARPSRTGYSHEELIKLGRWISSMTVARI